MKSSHPSRTLFAVLAVLLVLVPLLAVLQYQWIGEVSQADRQRREESLSRSGISFAREFDGELMRVATSFQIRGSLDAPGLRTQLTDRYDASSATDPGLVRRILVARPTDMGLQLQQFDPKAAALRPIDWPSEFALLRDNLQARSERFGERRPPPPPRLTLSVGPAVVAIPVMPDGDQRFGPDGFGRGVRSGGPIQTAGWTIVELDPKVFAEEFIPTMVTHHFTANNSEYRIAIATRGSTPEVIYKSSAEFSDADMLSPDLRIPLMGLDSGRGRQPGGGPPQPQFQRGGQPGGPPGEYAAEQWSRRPGNYL